MLLVLVLVTALAGGYLYISHRNSGSGLANNFVSVDQRVAAAARAIPAAAQKIQRFDEVHTWDTFALTTLSQMGRDRDLLEKIAKTQSGSSRQIAERAATAAQQAANAGILYRDSVAVTYNLSDADNAKAAMLGAAATLDQTAQAWQKG